MDAEVLNHISHVINLMWCFVDRCPFMEFLVLGLSKGTVVIVNVRKLDRVYLRQAIHRDAITVIKYLTHTNVFVSFCKEKYLKVWRVHEKYRRVEFLLTLRLDREIKDIISLGKCEMREGVERFMMVQVTGESEIFEYDRKSNGLFWLESEKTREHYIELTSFDYNPVR